MNIVEIFSSTFVEGLCCSFNIRLLCTVQAAQATNHRIAKGLRPGPREPPMRTANALRVHMVLVHSKLQRVEKCG